MAGWVDAVMPVMLNLFQHLIVIELRWEKW